MPEWPEPQPTDGPEFHAEHTFWRDAQARRKQLAKQGDDTVPRTFAPDFTRVSAGAARAALADGLVSLGQQVARGYNAWLSGLEVLLSRHVDRAMVLEGRTLLLPQHSAEAEAAMSAELVACTLGARSRPELCREGDPFMAAGVK